MDLKTLRATKPAPQMFTFIEGDEPKQDPNVPNVVVVRLKRSYWSDGGGLHQRIDLNYLKRKSSGFNWVDEEVNMGGVDWAFRGLDLDKYDDGIYTVSTCNVSTDWESGYVDDYDICLVPYKEESDGAKR